MASTAICLSGGGIRSAAFPVGFLQAFCERRLLPGPALRRHLGHGLHGHPALLVGHQLSAWMSRVMAGYAQPGAVSYAATLTVALVLGLLAVNISSPDTFSMHELYKHRLVRAFLGSSNPRTCGRTRFGAPR